MNNKTDKNWPFYFTLYLLAVRVKILQIWKIQTLNKQICILKKNLKTKNNYLKMNARIESSARFEDPRWMSYTGGTFFLL